MEVEHDERGVCVVTCVCVRVCFVCDDEDDENEKVKKNVSVCVCVCVECDFTTIRLGRNPHPASCTSLRSIWQTRV